MRRAAHTRRSDRAARLPPWRVATSLDGQPQPSSTHLRDVNERERRIEAVFRRTPSVGSAVAGARVRQEPTEQFTLATPAQPGRTGGGHGVTTITPLALPHGARFNG